MQAHVTLSLRRYEPSAQDLIHEWDQVCVAVEGRQEVDFGHTGGTITAGQGVLVPQGQSHMVRSRGGSRIIILDIPCPTGRANLIPAAVWRGAVAKPFFHLDDGLRSLVDYFAHELEDDAVDAATAHHMSGMFIDAIRRRLDRRRKSAAICRALDLIHTHYALPLPVAELAAAAGMCQTTFNEKFSAATGRTPRDYCINLRLDHATNLVQASDLSIAEIALATGFSDQSALTRHMRCRLGTTPARLRKQVRKPS